MRMVTFAGPPSTGKTSVVVQALRRTSIAKERTAVVKFDCLASSDSEIYQSNGIASFTGLSAGQCPDHYFASNVPAVCEWGAAKNLDLLITESAGLCNRCSPYIEGVLAVCVIDFLAGIGAPSKIGPLLRMADAVVLTKGDMVSQAEREVFAHRIRKLAPHAQVIAVNGLTGQGSIRVAKLLESAPSLATLEERELRFATPSALCSYCLGEKRLGPDYRMGNTREIGLP